MHNLHLVKKIVTHDGRFHADEVFAIAFLLVFLKKKPGNLPIKRTRKNLPRELLDKSVAVIDVGMVHDVDFNNFDHHQISRGGEASLVLVLRAADPWYKDILLKEIFGQISDRDVGKPVRKAGLSFSSAIGIINERSGSEGYKFKIALWIAYQIMLSLVAKFEKSREDF